jgi:hypothetical protein
MANDTVKSEQRGQHLDGLTRFELLDEALRTGGPAAALENLAEQLTAAGEYRALLDALLLKARHELGLPLILSGSAEEITGPVRNEYEEQYVAAIRLVGSKFLGSGDIPAAWAYYRAIGENEPVEQAILAYTAPDGDERLGAVIEVAFNHGVSPRRGFELILDHYGTCPAISAFEQLPQDPSVRADCATRLIRHLHRELSANLRAEITRRGEVPPPGARLLADLIEGRPWLFADESYHIDISHLASVVRMATIVSDPEVIALAADLTEYGRRLSPRLQFEGPPPFQQIFNDHRVYLRALLGEDVDGAVAHFQAKLSAGDGDTLLGHDDSLPAQTLVNLLVRVGKAGAAIDVAADHLADLPDSALSCPSVAQLCRRAGEPDRLARIARDHDDLVNFTAARLESTRKS